VTDKKLTVFIDGPVGPEERAAIQAFTARLRIQGIAPAAPVPPTPTRPAKPKSRR